MKLSIILTAGILATASAFVPTPSIYTVHTSVYATTEVELVAEPEGGTELTAVSSSLPGSRMKDMGPVEDGEDGVHSFWLSAIADGKKIKEFRAQTEKEASKKANFPGFRKGQIPPYAMPRMTAFAIQEAVIKTCESDFVYVISIIMCILVLANWHYLMHHTNFMKIMQKVNNLSRHMVWNHSKDQQEK